MVFEMSKDERPENMDNDISIVVKNVSKHFIMKGQVVKALNNISLEFKKGKLTTLLGPSGSGKTTLLRIIAGFENPDFGDVYIEGKNVTEIPPNKRGVSIVFQNYALFPHMTVFDNIAYGLRIRRFSEKEIQERVYEVARLVQLSETELKRYPNQLSGGQQQRVAVARAIVIRPKVLLLDEPLSNLDAKIKEYLRDEIRKLQLNLNITAIYITHDQSEAMAISDEIVVLNKGGIEQKGPPEGIYFRPVNRYVADFMGKANFISSQVKRVDKNNVTVTIGSKEFSFEISDRVQLNMGEHCEIVIRPEAVKIEKDENGQFLGFIKKVIFLGGMTEYLISIDEGFELLSRSLHASPSEVLPLGLKVGVSILPDNIQILYR